LAVRLRPTLLNAGLVRLLAALLLLQWGTAFGHCLRLAAPKALTVEICTAAGLHQLTVQAGDEDAPERMSAAASCPACQGPAAAALPAPSVSITPALMFAWAADPRPAAIVQPARPGPHGQPRAPPVS
jgi:hypothetical protein